MGRLVPRGPLARAIIRLMNRRRAVLIALGIYPVMVVVTILASLFLIGRGVDPIWAILLGFMLASIAFIVISLPIRIFVALRVGLRERGSPSIK